ncbi:MAG: hypothetical protein EAY79_11485 [Runella slithyformis]|nr:MAG: hypothetical protein EAY79_11485 [Runella slithyformis]
MSVFKFNLENIFTIESTFRRNRQIEELQYKTATNNLDIQITNRFDEDAIEVELRGIFWQETDGQKIVEGNMTILGVFRKEGEAPQEVVQNFCQINAPAILFPFIREAFSSASVKAGLAPIVLQPINFVEMAKQNTVKTLT